MINTAPLRPAATSVDILCKVRELALKILHKAWRAWFDKVEEAPRDNVKWQNHGEFRNQLCAIAEGISDQYA